MKTKEDGSSQLLQFSPETNSDFAPENRTTLRISWDPPIERGLTLYRVRLDVQPPPVLRSHDS